MHRLLLLILLLGLGYWAVCKFKRLPSDQRRKALWLYGLWGLAGLAVLLVLTGRLHWVGAAVATALPVLRQLLPLLLQYVPGLRRKVHSDEKNQSGEQSQTPAHPSGKMSRAEAFEVLGLANTASKDDIINAHRKLMQKLHPDRGGSDYLAARINEAKDVLLG